MAPPMLMVQYVGILALIILHAGLPPLLSRMLSASLIWSRSSATNQCTNKHARPKSSTLRRFVRIFASL